MAGGFQPLLDPLATAALNPSDIAAPIRSILNHQSKLQVIRAEASAGDPASRPRP